MPIDLYFLLGSPPCRAVLMTIKHLGLTVNIINTNFREGETKTPEYLKMNPQHTVPTIVDDGFTLWESRAIMQYLVSKYAPNSGLYPTDLKKRAVVHRLLYNDMTVIYAIRDTIVSKVFFGKEPTEFAIMNLDNNLTILNTLISDNKYVAGSELTIADLSYLASLSLLMVNEYKDLDKYPNLKRWCFRLQKELPYYDEVNGKVAQFFKEFIEKQSLKKIL